jgi:hypothetical protein
VDAVRLLLRRIRVGVDGPSGELDELQVVVSDGA